MKTPFLWAGSKDRDYPEIAKFIPPFKRYFEPFIGGGSVFFRLLADRGPFPAICADIHPGLIATYEAIRDDPEGLIAALPEVKDKETFKALVSRKSFDSKIEQAAAFLYCNRNRFFGMGGWMVADRYARKAVVDRIRYFSPLMQQSVFTSQGCWDVSIDGGADAFVFCDPPYPGTNTEACYRMDADVMDLNLRYFDRVANSGAKFFWVTKFSETLFTHASRPGVQVEKRNWAFRKPGKGVQEGFELYAWNV